MKTPTSSPLAATRQGVQFYTFYHPHIRDFIQDINVSGLETMLSLPSQELADMQVHVYSPTPPDPASGYNDDGVAFFVFDPNSPMPGGTQPLYESTRAAGSPTDPPPDSILSIDPTEPLWTTSLTQGYSTQGNGLAGYVYGPNSSQPGTLPLYRMNAPLGSTQVQHSILYD